MGISADVLIFWLVALIWMEMAVETKKVFMDECETANPTFPAPEDKLYGDIVRFVGPNNLVVQVCTNCDMKNELILCKISSTWKQGFIFNDNVIRSATNRSLAVTMLGNSEGSLLVLEPYEGKCNQQWEVEPDSRIRNSNGLRIDVRGRQIVPLEYGLHAIASADCQNQVWTTEPYVYPQLLKIIHQQSGLALDVPNGFAEGTHIVMNIPNNNINQKWELDGRVFRNAFNGLVLDGPLSTSPEAVLMAENQGTTQHWTMEKDGTISRTVDNMALDPGSERPKPGTKITIQRRTENANQKWKLVIA